MTCASESCPGSIRSARNSVSVSSAGCLQLLHNRRTSLCATTARTEDATRNGCTPRSIKRATDEGASLVCSVLNTRWPVRLALVAMLAVSRSRISPIIMMFGAWRRMERNAAGNVMPISVFDRFFDRNDFAVRFVDVIETGVKRGRLAGARRPSHEENPVRQSDQALEAFLVVR